MTKQNAEPDTPPWSDVPAHGPILRPAHAAEYLGFSVPHFYEQASRGLVPTPIKLGARATGVPKPWLDAVISRWATEAIAGAAR